MRLCLLRRRWSSIPTVSRGVLSGSDGLAVVWDVESGERLAVLAGPPGGVEHLAVGPDGSRVARDLAAVLEVNRNTVLRALRQLRDEGLLAGF
jgi:WD40 repeat protein